MKNMTEIHNLMPSRPLLAVALLSTASFFYAPSQASAAGIVLQNELDGYSGHDGARLRNNSTGDDVDLNGALLEGGFSMSVSAVPASKLGDANDDGILNNLDIAWFVLALADPSAYQAMFPDVDPEFVLDMNQDGAFNNLDIAGFVTALLGLG